METIDHQANFLKIKGKVEELMMQQQAVPLNLHDWDYTEKQLLIAEELIKKMDLSETDKYVVFYSVLFLYSGYSRDYDEPFKESRTIAEQMLSEAKYSESFIVEVQNAIGAVETPDQVANRLHGIVLDVDNAPLGQKNFKQFLNDWWVERSLNNQEETGEYEWLRRMNNQWNKFQFSSPRAQKKFDERKKSNLIELKKYLVGLRDSSSLNNNKSAQTMFKTTMRNQVDLISIADQKAGIMISINSILMTILLPLMASYLIDLSRFMIPAIIMVVTCGVTIITATLATRPDKMRGRLRADEIKQGERSLFYFGNFHEMDRDEYEHAIRGTIVRKNVLESSFINDLYDLGITLGRKYKHLRLCYLVFAVGIFLTLLSIAISMMVPMGF